MDERKLTRVSVVENLEKEIRGIDSIQKALSKGTIQESSEHEAYRDPLSLDVTKEVKILLSCGGPEDGFKLEFDDSDNLLGGVYYQADWGQYVEVALDDDEAQKVFDFYMFGDTSIIAKA